MKATILFGEHMELSCETIKHDRCPQLQLMESFSTSARKKSPSDIESKLFYHESIQRNWQLKYRIKIKLTCPSAILKKNFHFILHSFHSIRFACTALLIQQLPFHFLYFTLYCLAWLIRECDIISGLSPLLRLLQLFRVARTKDFNERTDGNFIVNEFVEFTDISRLEI